MKLTSNYLSALRINTDKNWLSYNITNLGRGNINLGSNQPLSSGLFSNDIGKNWADIGIISTDSTLAICYCGNGITLLVDSLRYLYRSTDYGSTWTEIDITSQILRFASLVYCGNGTVLLCAEATVFKSTDYGVTWSSIGAVPTVGAWGLAYCGNGIVILGAENNLFRSTDYGSNWTDLGAISATAAFNSISYCDNGIVIACGSDGYIFRSTDYGATWTDLGLIASLGIIRAASAYCGNGIVLLVSRGRILRSTDSGSAWTDLGEISSSDFNAISYCGNGIALAVDADGYIFKSSDFGSTWSDLGELISDDTMDMVYCGTGIVLSCDEAKHVYKSDVAFKLDENALDCVPSPVNYMDFWSDIDALVTLPADTALPNIVIADLPSGATVIRATLMLKYSAKKDTSTSDNQITAGKIQSKETTGGTYVDAINLINGEAKVTASTKEGGDVHVGDNDISGTTSDITGNCTVQSAFSSVTTTGASIELYDVQVGIRVYFT